MGIRHDERGLGERLNLAGSPGNTLRFPIVVEIQGDANRRGASAWSLVLSLEDAQTGAEVPALRNGGPALDYAYDDTAAAPVEDGGLLADGFVGLERLSGSRFLSAIYLSFDNDTRLPPLRPVAVLRGTVVIEVPQEGNPQNYRLTARGGFAPEGALPVALEVVADGVPFRPEVIPLEIRVRGIAESRPFFPLDVDGNREANVTDAIFLLDYLFFGGREPPCLEAADTTDNETIDISDAITILSCLFLDRSCPRPLDSCQADETPNFGCLEAGCEA